MEEIRILENGREIGRVVSGPDLGGASALLAGEKAVYMVHDRNAEHFADKIAESAGCGIIRKKAIEATEQTKNISTVMEICRWLLEENAGRNALLLAVGGGITTDLSGFAASIYKRGIRFAFVPTTLLAQIDAAVGGKTGVNMDAYKNMIGVIRQPLWTYECPEVLGTLPYREFVGGSAELLKTFIIDNRGGDYSRAVSLLTRINCAESRRNAIEAFGNEIMDLIHRAAAIKAGIVGRDQFENGERRLLNLGHTFAHAIEKRSNSLPREDFAGDMVDTRVPAGNISHGEAVAMGMVMAAELSEKSGTAVEPVAATLRNNLAACGLPVECPFTPDELEAAMGKDKKAEGGIIHFVLMRRIGETVIRDMTAREAIQTLKK
ncbi:MAG: 3-dehydroquinate synthase family protein [Candidatus Cryptobacteroides sp.]